MLAIVRAVQRFHVYLYGLQFVIVTDCNTLVHSVNKANLNPRIARWTLALQDYCFKLIHRPGKRMAHVDALSRSIAFVNQLPLERELEVKQLTDPKILDISRKLELENSDKFALVNGLVYKKENDNLRFVIPESMIASVIRAHHDEMAHCGFEKTIKGIERGFWCPSLRKRVYEYMENCLTCLMSNNAVNRWESDTQLYPLPKSPLEALHVDHFGPLQEIKHKKTYISSSRCIYKIHMVICGKVNQFK